MQIHLRLSFLLLSLAFAFDSARAVSIEDIGGSQGEYEKEIGAVVRNKRFFKTGHLEATVSGGTLPYDSVVRHFSAGGRLAWHLSDHYGWEIIDANMLFPTVTNFTNNTVQSYTISRLDALELKKTISTSFLLSPLYGKIRFFGSAVVYFDIYLVAGVGAAQTDVKSFSMADASSPVVETLASSGWDPMMNLGLGVKVFASRAFGVTVDLRDYVTYSEKYGSRSLISNFAVTAGLTFFLPNF